MEIMSKPKILVVDDDAKLTSLLRIILERVGGFQVREENRSFAALNTAREYRPHFILLDVDMPGKDGGDVAAEFRADPDFCRIPIVFLTSLVSSTELTTLGEDRFLAKPVDPQLLVRTVKSLLPAMAA
jgi:two-component system OmpR family response regulator